MAKTVSGPLLTGNVTSRQTGAPLAGVTVTVSATVYTDPELSAGGTTSLTTNGAGSFSAYARPGVYTFTCSDPSAAPIEPVEILSSDEGGSGASEALVSALLGRRRELPQSWTVDAVMASPPVVGALATATAITGAVAWPSITSSGSTRIPTGEFFTYRCNGGFVVHGTAFPDYTYVHPTGLSSGSQFYIADFFFDGTQLELNFKGVTGFVRVRVDGQLVSATAVTIGNTGSQYFMPITFASRATRRVSVEMYNAPWGGVTTGPNDTVWAANVRGPRVIVVGDSYTAGTGAAGATVTNWVRRFAEWMGWQDVWPSGVGGTGYLNPGAVVKFRDRAATDWQAWAPDVLIYAGGHNDIANYTAAAIGAEAAALYAADKAALPKVVQIVVGPFWGSAEQITPAAIDTRDAIKAAALAAGAYYVDTMEQPLSVAAAATTLQAQANAAATTISLGTVIPVHSTVEIDVGAARERRRITAVSGVGPFTHTIATALTATHANGTSVTQVGGPFLTGTGKVGTTTGIGNSDLLVSSDGTHPAQAGHEVLGVLVGRLIAASVLAA